MLAVALVIVDPQTAFSACLIDCQYGMPPLLLVNGLRPQANSLDLSGVTADIFGPVLLEYGYIGLGGRGDGPYLFLPQIGCWLGLEGRFL